MRCPTSRLWLLLPTLAFLGSAISPLGAQSPRPLPAGSTVSDALATGEVDVFEIELPAESFLLGWIDQRGVDTVVRVAGPLAADGTAPSLDVLDTSRRGREAFEVRSSTPGMYQVRVEAFEDEAGDYAIEVGQPVPLATTAEGKVAQRFARWDRDDGPGVVVGVVDGGELVFSRGFGMANLTHGVPFTPETPSNIGSVSKQFTAVALLVLAKEGALSLDDTLRSHLPELPAVAEGVTLRHLLQHTSGLREVLNALAMAGWEPDDSLARSEVYALLAGQQQLQFPSGSEHVYNNTGYLLLADLVERVGGEPFDQWMAKHVFAPLGMQRTAVRRGRGQLVPGSAQGYVISREGQLVETSDIEGSYGAGGIYSTVGDLARWLGSFRTGGLIGEQGVATLTQPAALTSGEVTDYALGVAIDEYRGLRRVWHNGGDSAHTAMLAYLPDLDVGVAILGNTPGFAGMGHAEAVLEAFFGDRLPAEVAVPAEPVAMAADEAAAEASATMAAERVLEESTMARYVGIFELVGPGILLEFRREGDGMVTQIQGQPPLALQPITETELAIEGLEGVRIVFHPEEGADPTAPVTRATLHQMGEHALRRIAEWQPSLEQLAAFAGRYQSDELEAFWTLELVDGVLQARNRRLEDPVAFAPKEEDSFAGGAPLLEVRFARDAEGRITGFHGSFARTRDVWFERLP